MDLESQLEFISKISVPKIKMESSPNGLRGSFQDQLRPKKSNKKISSTPWNSSKKTSSANRNQLRPQTFNDAKDAEAEVLAKKRLEIRSQLATKYIEGAKALAPASPKSGVMAQNPIILT